jgi:hypothetical protein
MAIPNEVLASTRGNTMPIEPKANIRTKAITTYFLFLSMFSLSPELFCQGKGAPAQKR